ncbi:MAG: hypothetical protein J0L66_05540 [Cytophagales bacterium]|nr:hypothetical protein [Cytophagales bacterium]
MELDEFKEIWKQPSVTENSWSTDQLHEVLRGKSKSIVSDIKRSMRIEITIGSIALLVLISQIILLRPGPILILMIAILVFTLVVATYFYFKMRLVTNFNFSTHNLKDNLMDLITKLEVFLKVYKLGNQWGLIVFYVFGLTVVYLERGADRIAAYITSWQGAIFIILYSGCIIAPIFIVDKILHKLYGKHIIRLKELLNNFENPPE